MRQLRWSGLRSLPNTLPQRKPIPYPRPVRLLSSSPPFTFQPCTHAPLPTLPSTKIPPDSHSLATTNADPLFRSQIPNNARNIYRTLMNYTSPISDLAGTTMLQRCRGNHRAFVVERKWGCSESADMGTDSWARLRTGSDPGVRGGVINVIACPRVHAGGQWVFRPSVSLFSFLPVFPSFFLPSCVHISRIILFRSSFCPFSVLHSVFSLHTTQLIN